MNAGPRQPCHPERTSRGARPRRGAPAEQASTERQRLTSFASLLFCGSCSALVVRSSQPPAHGRNRADGVFPPPVALGNDIRGSSVLRGTLRLKKCPSTPSGSVRFTATCGSPSSSGVTTAGGAVAFPPRRRRAGVPGLAAGARPDLRPRSRARSRRRCATGPIAAASHHPRRSLGAASRRSSADNATRP